ncbi:MAG: hypothetical protein PHF00_12590 [Elusimicrobia bacterium]|nr:hypothetical protein [Elusimicrobiota bacterium]
MAISEQPVTRHTEEERHPGLEPERTAKVVGYGSLGETFGGVGGAILAILGLAGLSPQLMSSIAALVLGAALILEGGSIVARYTSLIDELGIGTRFLRSEVGGGMTAELFGGFAGVALGILAVMQVKPLELVTIAALVYGAVLIMGSGTISRLNALPVPQNRAQERAVRLASDAIIAASRGQLLVGLGVVILSVLSLVGIQSMTLNLVSLLSVGAGAVFSGLAVSERMFVTRA